MGGGDAYVGGNMTWNNPSLPHSAYVVGNFTNNASGGSDGGRIYYGGTYSSGVTLSREHVNPRSIPAPIDFLSAKTSLDSLSESLAGYAANGIVNHSYSTYTLTGTDASLNVFNLTDASYAGATINVNAPAGSTVVVNVAGSSVSFTYGSINLNGLAADHVIFNFDRASALSLNGIGFNGSILAPFANFSGTWGQINGQLIALSAAGTTQLNDVLFSGTLPAGTTGLSSTQISATPEPSTWLCLFAGIAGMGFIRRRGRFAPESAVMDN
jgi:choice-of-anchor A domain-containing protein